MSEDPTKPLWFQFRLATLLVAVIIVTAFVAGITISRMAPLKNPVRTSDVPWMALCAPSYFTALFVQGIFEPFFPFSVPFALANGLLYAGYAAIALTPRLRWVLLGVLVLHGACGFLIVMLAGFSGIRG